MPKDGESKYLDGQMVLGSILAIFLVLIISSVLVFKGIRQNENDLPEKPKLNNFKSYAELEGFLKFGKESYSLFTHDFSIFFGGSYLESRPLGLGVELQAFAVPDSKGSNEHSTTNVQVEGVDEADIVKNDGNYIYAVTGDKIVIIGAFPPENSEITDEILVEGDPWEIFVKGDRLAVLGLRGRRTFVDIYDISDRTAVNLAEKISVDGRYFDSRMIGKNIYVIANLPVRPDNIELPKIFRGNSIESISATEIRYFGMPLYSNRFTVILSINIQDTDDFSKKVFLTGGAQNLFVSSKNIFITGRKSYNLELRSKFLDEVILPSLPTDIPFSIKASYSSNPKSFEDLFNLVSVLNDYMESLGENEKEDLLESIRERTSNFWNEIRGRTERTVVHRISIGEGDIEYGARGEVPGTVLNQFSMDEHEGYFRIATTTGRISRISSKAGAKNHVYVLNQDLDIAGRLENLAPGERIYSARFMGDKGYLVTFRKIDPLFVMDLEDPKNPKVLGKLKIPGYSDYLHPYDDNYLIGIGKSTTAAEDGDFSWYQGVKIALFDVSDVNNPKVISKLVIGDRGTESLALRDHKAVLFSRSKNLLSFPVSVAKIDENMYPEGLNPWTRGDFVWQGAYVLNVSPEEGLTLKGRISHVEDNEHFLESGYYFRSPYSVKRSLYIENVLYTFSQNKISMNSLSNLDRINEINLVSQ